ncbi:peptidoglycan-binding domain-containing protein [Halovulum sp. GXIMD14794]
MARFRTIWRAAALWLGLLGPVHAADLALILSDSAAGAPARHTAVVEAFRAAGYDVTEALDPDRAELADLLTRFEPTAAEADRLVLHLTGRVAAAAGLTVLLPAGAAGDSAAELLTQGVPMPLFTALAGQRPGRSLLALGLPDGPDGSGIDIPQGVLLMSGAPADVDRVLTGPMLGGNLAAVEIGGNEGVAFAGLVTDLLRLGGSAPQATPAASADEERVAWDAAREVDTLEAYRTFLRRWGDGRFASRARDRVETLETAAETAERVARYREIEVGLELTTASVAELQKRLMAMGFSPGATDGVISRQTRQSVAAFQARSGLTPTGYFNTATVQRLIIAGGG